MKSGKAISAGVVVVVGTMVVVWILFNSIGNLEHLARQDTVQEDVAIPVGAIVPETIGVKERIEAGGTDMIVIDAATEAPIADCFVAVECAGRQALRAAAIGRYVGNGRIHLDSVPDVLGVFAPGYQSAEVHRAAVAGHEHVVRLQRGCRLELRCIYPDGAPASGVLLSLETAVPVVANHADMASGARVFPCPGRRGRWSGVSDSFGAASVSEFASGAYCLCIDAQFGLPEGGCTRAITLVSGATHRVDVRILPYVGFHIISRAVPICSWRWQGDQQRYSNCGKAIQEAVEDLYGCLLSCPAHDIHDSWVPGPGVPGEGDVIDVEFLTVSGWVMRTVRVDRMDGSTPQILDAASEDGVDGKRIRIAAAGVPGPLRFMSTSPWGGVNMVLIRPGSEQWLPYGEYRVLDEFGRSCYQGGILSWRLDSIDTPAFDYGDSISVDLRIRLADGGVPRFAVVRAEWSCGSALVPGRYAGRAHNGRASFLAPREVANIMVEIAFPEAGNYTTAVAPRSRAIHDIEVPLRVLQ